VFARLGLPVLALLVLVTATRPGAGLIAAAAVGLALLAALAGGLGLLMRSESFAVWAGCALQRILTTACRLARRQLPPGAAGWLPGFRDRAGALITARGWQVTAATAASNLTLWLVLLACLRGIGLSQAQVPWQTCLAAFAFVRLLTVLPITPGGLGVTELGLIAILAAGAGHRATAQVTAAVLLYRAVTYLPPIPLGAIACLVWRHAPALIHAKPADAGQPADMSPSGPDGSARGLPQGDGDDERPAGLGRQEQTLNQAQVTATLGLDDEPGEHGNEYGSHDGTAVAAQDQRARRRAGGDEGRPDRDRDGAERSPGKVLRSRAASGFGRCGDADAGQARDG
ncbi:MAG TPA: YbhN family protein, partial [Streptosporangiaceae bacterium]|nr:YbhN family protein [Streptosporangiaceae bacterium]